MSKRPPARHPIQPLYRDKDNRVLFKSNAIVQHLLDHGGIDLNKLAVLDFTNEDRQQFAQLIGYSLSGYSDLSYVDADAYSVAEAVALGKKEDAARIAYLEGELYALRKALQGPMARLFGVHPDDLGSAPQTTTEASK